MWRVPSSAGMTNSLFLRFTYLVRSQRSQEDLMLPLFFLIGRLQLVALIFDFYPDGWVYRASRLFRPIRSLASSHLEHSVLLWMLTGVFVFGLWLTLRSNQPSHATGRFLYLLKTGLLVPALETAFIHLYLVGASAAGSWRLVGQDVLSFPAVIVNSFIALVCLSSAIFLSIVLNSLMIDPSFDSSRPLSQLPSQIENYFAILTIIEVFLIVRATQQGQVSLPVFFVIFRLLLISKMRLNPFFHRAMAYIHYNAVGMLVISLLLLGLTTAERPIDSFSFDLLWTSLTLLLGLSRLPSLDIFSNFVLDLKDNSSMGELRLMLGILSLKTPSSAQRNHIQGLKQFINSEFDPSKNRSIVKASPPEEVDPEIWTDLVLHTKSILSLLLSLNPKDTQLKAIQFAFAKEFFQSDEETFAKETIHHRLDLRFIQFFYKKGESIEEFLDELHSLDCIRLQKTVIKVASLAKLRFEELLKPVPSLESIQRISSLISEGESKSEEIFYNLSKQFPWNPMALLWRTFNSVALDKEESPPLFDIWNHKMPGWKSTRDFIVSKGDSKPSLILASKKGGLEIIFASQSMGILIGVRPEELTNQSVQILFPKGTFSCHKKNFWSSKIGVSSCGRDQPYVYILHSLKHIILVKIKTRVVTSDPPYLFCEFTPVYLREKHYTIIIGKEGEILGKTASFETLSTSDSRDNIFSWSVKAIFPEIGDLNDLPESETFFYRSKSTIFIKKLRFFDEEFFALTEIFKPSSGLAKVPHAPSKPNFQFQLGKTGIKHCHHLFMTTSQLKRMNSMIIKDNSEQFFVLEARLRHGFVVAKDNPDREEETEVEKESGFEKELISDEGEENEKHFWDFKQKKISVSNQKNERQKRNYLENFQTQLVSAKTVTRKKLSSFQNQNSYYILSTSLESVFKQNKERINNSLGKREINSSFFFKVSFAIFLFLFYFAFVILISEAISSLLRTKLQMSRANSHLEDLVISIQETSTSFNFFVQSSDEARLFPSTPIAAQFIHNQISKLICLRKQASLLLQQIEDSSFLSLVHSNIYSSQTEDKLTFFELADHSIFGLKAIADGEFKVRNFYNSLMDFSTFYFAPQATEFLKTCKEKEESITTELTLIIAFSVSAVVCFASGMIVFAWVINGIHLRVFENFMLLFEFPLSEIHAKIAVIRSFMSQLLKGVHREDQLPLIKPSVEEKIHISHSERKSLFKYFSLPSLVLIAFILLSLASGGVIAVVVMEGLSDFSFSSSRIRNRNIRFGTLRTWLINLHFSQKVRKVQAPFLFDSELLHGIKENFNVELLDKLYKGYRTGSVADREERVGVFLYPPAQKPAECSLVFDYLPEEVLKADIFGKLIELRPRFIGLIDFEPLFTPDYKNLLKKDLESPAEEESTGKDLVELWNFEVFEVKALRDDLSVSEERERTQIEKRLRNKKSIILGTSIAFFVVFVLVMLCLTCMMLNKVKKSEKVLLGSSLKAVRHSRRLRTFFEIEKEE